MSDHPLKNLDNYKGLIWLYLKDLDPKQASIFFMRIDGMSYKDIGKYHGLSVNRISNIVEYAERRITYFFKDPDRVNYYIGILKLT